MSLEGWGVIIRCAICGTNTARTNSGPLILGSEAWVCSSCEDDDWEENEPCPVCEDYNCSCAEHYGGGEVLP